MCAHLQQPLEPLRRALCTPYHFCHATGKHIISRESAEDGFICGLLLGVYARHAATAADPAAACGTQLGLRFSSLQQRLMTQNEKVVGPVTMAVQENTATEVARANIILMMP